MPNPSLISVIDDDDSVRKSLEGLMRSVGFAVKTFASAEEFLNSDHHLRDTDCLILDVRMPEMNGIELHRHLIANHYAMRVIFITGQGFDEEVRSEALKNGAVDCLDKPLSEGALLKAVDTALSSK